MFIGDLSNDAQGVYQSLRRCRLHRSVLDQIEHLYRLAWQSGDLEEIASKRSARTSFNPRPARLMAIAIKELGYPAPIDPVAIDRFEAVLLALAANPKKSAKPEIAHQFDAIVEAIVLIDDLRHAHLHPRSNSEILESLEEFEGILPDRLFSLLKAAHKNAALLKDAEVDAAAE